MTGLAPPTYRHTYLQRLTGIAFLLETSFLVRLAVFICVIGARETTTTLLEELKRFPEAMEWALWGFVVLSIVPFPVVHIASALAYVESTEPVLAILEYARMNCTYSLQASGSGRENFGGCEWICFEGESFETDSLT